MTQEALIKARNQLKRAAQVIQSLCPQGYIHPVLGSIHGAIVDAQEALSEHAMREVQRLGQEIEQEPVCPECKAIVLYECVACSSNNYPPQPEQEPVVWADYESKGIHHKPVAWMDADGNVSDNNDHKCFPIPLYTTPPQRKPLTDKAITKVIDSMPRGINGWMSDWDLYEFARAIEAKLKENT